LFGYWPNIPASQFQPKIKTFQLAKTLLSWAVSIANLKEEERHVNYPRLEVEGLGLTHRWTCSVRDGSYSNLANLMAGWLTLVASNHTAHQLMLV
jgi:hypothetical protein